MEDVVKVGGLRVVTSRYLPKAVAVAVDEKAVRAAADRIMERLEREILESMKSVDTGRLRSSVSPSLPPMHVNARCLLVPTAPAASEPDLSPVIDGFGPPQEKP